MLKNRILTERLLDSVVPLVLLLAIVSVYGQGFPSLKPVVAGTVYSVIQPFFRFFLFDRIRQPLFVGGLEVLFFSGAAVCYSALAVGVARMFI